MYNNYKILKSKFIKEVDSECTVLEHDKTKCKIILLRNSDKNKVFNIAFRTPVSDNTGVPHILEHSVLCGSKKYPIKDPFVELAKSSFNTFLNAMTFPDKTCYPVASCNYKDFRNLMDVYLDAVFNPNIYKNKQIFMQEGWHYEVNENNDLFYNGVVYNEMKGVYSDPESILEREVLASIFSGTNYQYEYGGDPINIPDLTYENFLSFHKKFYHPSNAYIYLYGDMDFDEVLSYIDSEYLSKYEYENINSKIHSFKPFLTAKEEICYYNEEKGDRKDYISYTFAIKNSKDIRTEIICKVLSHYLMDSSSGLISTKLLSENICDDSSASFQNEMVTGLFNFEIKKADANNKNKFQKIVDDALYNLYKNGFDKEKLKSCINKLKFIYKENDSGAMPKGLIYSLDILSTWLYDYDPFSLLIYEDEIDNINENDVRKFLLENFINNTSKTIIACVPNKSHFDEINTRENKRITTYQNSLDTNEFNRIVDECNELKSYQMSSESSEDLAVLPSLKVSDIEKVDTILTYEVEKTEVNNKKSDLIYVKSNNNGIIYYNLNFDITNLNINFYPFLTILSHFYTMLPTKNYDLVDLNNKIDTNVGNISFDEMTGRHKNIYTIGVKVLEENLHTSLDLVNEILTNTLFNDKKRIIELIKNLKAESSNRIIGAPHIACSKELSAHYSKFSFIENKYSIGCIEFNEFINNLCNLILKDDKNLDILINIISNLSKYVFTNTLEITLSCEDESKFKFIKELKSYDFEFMHKKPNISYNKFFKEPYRINFKKKNTAYEMPTDVSYVGRSCPLYQEKLNGSMLVLKTIWSYDYLWTNIRVLGGAYGAISKIAESDGIVFVSYRDPHIKNTNKVYDGLIKYFEHKNISDEEVEKYIIGTMATIDKPKSNYLNFIFNIIHYYNMKTNEDFVRLRNEVINTNKSKIYEAIKIIKKTYHKSNYSVISNKKIIEKENCRLYDEVRIINV